MTTEQWIGLWCVAIGTYFIYGAVWKRGFFLYKLQADRAAKIIGASATHTFYTVMGIVLIVIGAVKAIGIF